MRKSEFDHIFQGLPKRRKEYLLRFLRGQSDREVAQELCKKEGTIRSQIRNAIEDFGIENEFEDDHSSRRDQLKALFQEHRPDLVIGSDVSKSCDECEFDPEFVGREKAIADLDRLVQRGKRCILIQSAGGTGKTTLAEQYLQQRFQDSYLRFDVAKESKNLGSIESRVREWLRNLGEEPGQDFFVSLERLRSQLQSKFLGVLVDNLEPALDGKGKFRNENHNYVELLRVLSDKTLKSTTLITSRERIWENLSIEIYKLESLNLQDWVKYFSLNEITPNIQTLGEIHKVYQGNALAMKTVNGRVVVDYGNNVERYWKFCQTSEGFLVETDVDNLIAEQFDRLQSSQGSNEIAYKLLCRMGCFRYQDVPTVPIEGLLALLWDIPQEEDKRAAIRILRDRALITYDSNGEYKIHPIIRAEAIKRLRDSEDWRNSNSKAAEFWNCIATIECINDAYRALEAYHHYVAISDFEMAAFVLTEGRDNQWEILESLGRSLYRLGLLREAISCIEETLGFIESKQRLCLLQNILGDIYWLSGNPRRALYHHKKSRRLAQETQNASYLHRAIFNAGLCYLDLGENKKSLLFFEKSIKSRESSGEWQNCFAVESYICLLKVINGESEALFYLKKALCNLYPERSKSSIVWSYGYSLLSIGLAYNLLNDHEKALEKYNQAIRYANETSYTQLEAKAWLFMSKLYRDEKHFDNSISDASNSIQVMSKIGAKCDLAEAYYQRALTYQEMGDPRCQDDFAEALRLWGKDHIDAPKQIERVKASMNTPL